MKKLTKAQAKARRERIALVAMAAIIRKHPVSTSHDDGMPGEVHMRIARGARRYADAMIAELDAK